MHDVRRAGTTRPCRARRRPAVCTANARPTPIQTRSGRYFVASTRVAMKVLSGSSTRKMAANVSPTTTRIHQRRSSSKRAGGGDRGGEDVGDRAAERGGRAGDVVVLGLRVDDSPSWRASLTAIALAVDLDRDHLAVEGVLGERAARARRWWRSGGRSRPARRRRASAVDQDAEGVGRPALLHQDRRQPGVAGAGVEQGGDHRRPDPRVEVVDVGLDEQRGASAAASRSPATKIRSTLACPSGSRPPAPMPIASRSSPAAGPTRSATVVSIAAPVGVHSSMAGAPGGRRTTGSRGSSSATAGGGTGRVPCAPRTVPEPTATGETYDLARRRGGRTRRTRRRCRRSRPARRPRGSGRRAGRCRGRAPRRTASRSKMRSARRATRRRGRRRRAGPRCRARCGGAPSRRSRRGSGSRRSRCGAPARPAA